jgi:enoyl-CoA hydratase
MTDDLISDRQNALGIITLNRPAALNALSLPMIRGIAAQLKIWESDPSISAVLFLGAGDRAFCAGGDIKEVWKAGQVVRENPFAPNPMIPYFADEYRLNRQLYHYPKPLIAFMDGITMGGGYGIAGHCRFRIATEKTMFAMPEVGIGFSPDVGSMAYLARCPDFMGRYLALTGHKIDAVDMMHAGLASDCMSSESKERLIKTLSETLPHYEVADILNDFAADPLGAGDLRRHVNMLDRTFDDLDVLTILEKLREQGGDFAAQTADLMASRSPTALLVTAEHLRCAEENPDFDTIIERDYQMVQHCLEGADFYEGVRAAVVDKDRNPRWTPPRLEDVKPTDVARYFTPAAFDLSHEFSA